MRSEARPRRRAGRRVPAAHPAVAVAGLLLSGCAGGPVADDPAADDPAADEPVATRPTAGAGPGTSTLSTHAPSPSPRSHPDVETATLTRRGDVHDLTVTISSGYDSPQRYADGWRVLAPDGEVLATHDLAHHHAGEQPFTRTQRGVRIPPGVREVVVEGRDSRNGWGGTTVRVPVP